MFEFASQSIVSWSTTGLESGVIGWPGVFFSVEQARAFAGQFLKGQSGIHLLGIGMHAKLVDGFLAEEKPKDSEGPAGIYDAIESRMGLEANGIELVSEVGIGRFSLENIVPTMRVA